MENIDAECRRFSSCRGVSFEINCRENSFTGPGQIDRSDPLSSRWQSCDVRGKGNVSRWNSISEVAYPDLEKQLAGDVVAQHCDQRQIDKVETTAKSTKTSESRLSVILLDQGLFTVYKKLFALCLALNMVFLALALNGNFPYGKRKAAAFAIYDVLVLTMCRSEIFLRLVFWCTVKALGRSRVPIWVKAATTSFLQSIGGIHSGCGVSSVAWLVYALALTLKNRKNTSLEIIGVASAILSLLFFSCLTAFPQVRHLHHNFFERAHRFAGWTALALLWAFVVLAASYDAESKSYDKLTMATLVRQQEIWLTSMVTALIVIPWVSVRRVPVSVTSPSGHASIIKFAGGVKAGLLGRISRSPLSEWHAFGIISENRDSHVMLAGAVGDFTRGLVSDPPNHLWVRRVHFAGLPYLINMYGRVLLVATGSGIAVFLSFLLQPCNAEVCLLWVTKSVDQNFGSEIKEMLSGQKAGKMLIHDTAVSGRPDVAKLAVEAAKSWKAEVVIVTSNPQGSRDVVNACMAERIPAFGPIWDS